MIINVYTPLTTIPVLAIVLADSKLYFFDLKEYHEHESTRHAAHVNAELQKRLHEMEEEIKKSRQSDDEEKAKKSMKSEKSRVCSIQ